VQIRPSRRVRRWSQRGLSGPLCESSPFSLVEDGERCFSRKGLRHREASIVLVAAAASGRHVLPRLSSSRWQTPSRGAFRRAALRAAAGWRQLAVVAAERVPRERAPLVSALGPRPTPWTARASARTSKSSRRDTMRRRTVGFVRRGNAYDSEPQGRESPEVDALVSTPLRPGRLGPGSGRLLSRCALLAKGPRPRRDRLRAGRMRSAESSSRRRGLHLRWFDRPSWTAVRGFTGPGAE
jgi:hypothetical protein